MRVIIAGTRSMANGDYVDRAMRECGITPTCVVSGGCRGIDASGEVWAGKHGVPVFRYPADWQRHGRAAGPIRNADMANNADALVCVWDGKSRGTKNMIDTAIRKRLPVFILCPWPWKVPAAYEALTQPLSNSQ